MVDSVSSGILIIIIYDGEIVVAYMNSQVLRYNMRLKGISVVWTRFRVDGLLHYERVAECESGVY